MYTKCIRYDRNQDKALMLFLSLALFFLPIFNQMEINRLTTPRFSLSSYSTKGTKIKSAPQEMRTLIFDRQDVSNKEITKVKSQIIKKAKVIEVAHQTQTSLDKKWFSPDPSSLTAEERQIVASFGNELPKGVEYQGGVCDYGRVNGLNVSEDVDFRVFTKEGRQEWKVEKKQEVENFKNMGDNVVLAGQRVGETYGFAKEAIGRGGNVVDMFDSYENQIKSQVVADNTQANNKEATNTINDATGVDENGKERTALDAKDAYSELSENYQQEFGSGEGQENMVEVYDGAQMDRETDIQKEVASAKGAVDEESGKIMVNVGIRVAEDGQATGGVDVKDAYGMMSTLGELNSQVAGVDNEYAGEDLSNAWKNANKRNGRTTSNTGGKSTAQWYVEQRNQFDTYKNDDNINTLVQGSNFANGVSNYTTVDKFTPDLLQEENYTNTIVGEGGYQIEFESTKSYFDERSGLAKPIGEDARVFEKINEAKFTYYGKNGEVLRSLKGNTVPNNQDMAAILADGIYEADWYDRPNKSNPKNMAFRLEKGESVTSLKVNLNKELNADGKITNDNYGKKQATWILGHMGYANSEYINQYDYLPPEGKVSLGCQSLEHGDKGEFEKFMDSYWKEKELEQYKLERKKIGWGN